MVCVGVDEVCLLYFIYSTTKCVCMSVCVLAAAVTIKPTDVPVMLEFNVYY